MGIYRTNLSSEYRQVDGIVIDEKAPTPLFRGVGTGVSILVGQFDKGPKNALTNITSRDYLLTTFGSGRSGYNALLNKRFPSLKVIRVDQTDAVKADYTFQGTGNVDSITFTAITAGAAGNNITVAVETGTTANTKKYVITSGTTTETYDNVTQANAVSTINGDSAFVTVTVDSASLLPTNATATNLTGGADIVVSDTNYQTAIAVAEAENSGNIIFLDEYNDTRNGYLKTHVETTEDKIAICAGPEAQTVAQVETAAGNVRDDDGRIIYAYNWVETLINDTKTYVSPASFVATLLANTAPHIDPAYSRNTKFLYGISAVKNNLTRANFISLLQAGVAAFEYDTDIGFKLKSGIVTQIANSSKVTILRRRMTDFLTNSMGRILKEFQNGPNRLEDREAAKAAMMNFIQEQENLGVLPKDEEVQDGTAKTVDITSLNTNTSIAEGNFYINYRQRIYSSMRYIILIAEVGQSVVVEEG